MEGTIKWFNRRKGYGFIAGDDGNEYFVHHTAVQGDAFLNENDKVSFDPVQDDRGRKAQNVVKQQGKTGQKKREQEEE